MRRLPYADKERVNTLSKGIADHAWNMLDGEPELDGEVVGNLVHCLVVAFVIKYTELFSVDT